MDIIFWIMIISLFIISFVGLVYPIIPGVLFLIGGFLFYGFFYSFEVFNWFFWVVEGLLMILLFIADYASNYISVKKFGGSKAGIWGSTIGLIVGPFVIPFLGILIGPFLGAVIAELIMNKENWKNSLKIGFGSVIGFISSVVTKGMIQFIMVIIFFLYVF